MDKSERIAQCSEELKTELVETLDDRINRMKIKYELDMPTVEAAMGMAAIDAGISIVTRGFSPTQQDLTDLQIEVTRVVESFTRRKLTQDDTL